MTSSRFARLDAVLARAVTLAAERLPVTHAQHDK